MYDLIIIGAGPGGLSASVYASRYKLNHLVLGKEVGGTISWAHMVDNYPGLPGLTGRQLADKFIDHAKSLGATIENKEINSLVSNPDKSFTLTSTDNSTFQTKTVILATGTKRRELGVPGEKELVGKGVSYCPTCDAPFYKGKTVVVVGGADAACSGAIHLAQFAQKVYLLYRKNQLRADATWLKEVQSNPKIQVLYETNILKILPNPTTNNVGSVEIDREFESKKVLTTDGVFIEIGGVPLVVLAQKIGITLDETGFVITNDKQETNIPGIYCVGDMGSHWQECQQVITAAAEGAVASHSIYEYIHRS